MLRKLLTLVLATGALAAAAPVTAADTTVAITRTGFVPSAISITTADKVTWTNRDDSNHQVVSQEAGFASPILKPGDTFSHTFAKAGVFTVGDTYSSAKSTVTVRAPAGAVTLNASRSLVTYTGRIALSGVVSSRDAGQQVNVLRTQCGALSSLTTRFAVVQTTAGGEFTLTVQPLRNTTYVVRWQDALSDRVAVQVKPLIRLGKASPRRYTVRVFAAQSFAGRLVVLQRWNARLGTWVRVRTAILHRGSPAIDPTVVSSTRLTATVKHRTRLRVVMTRSQVGACYLPGVSNTVIA